MLDWRGPCAKAEAYTTGCEGKREFLYTYKLNVDRRNVYWKYLMYSNPPNVTIQNCTIGAQPIYTMVWGNHNELYPLLSILEDPPLNLGRRKHNVFVMADGTCTIKFNKFENARLIITHVEHQVITQRAQFRVEDQLTPHGPSVGWIDQNQPETDACYRSGDCDRPKERVPCHGPHTITVRQSVMFLERDTKHRVVIKVEGPGAPCLPYIISDSEYDEVHHKHGPSSTELHLNVPLRRHVITIRAGDTWYEYEVKNDVHQIIHETEDNFTPIPKHWYDRITNWFGSVTAEMQLAYQLIHKVINWVFQNITLILVLLLMCSPLASAIPPPYRVLLIAISATVVRVKAGDEQEGEPLKAPLEMVLHLMILLFQRDDIVNPVSLGLVAVSNLIEIPMAPVTVSLIHAVAVSRDWISAISGGLAHQGGLLGVVVYHVMNSKALRARTRRLMRKAEHEAIEQLPEYHPWFDPPAMDLLRDIQIMQYHSADYVSTTLERFLRSSTEARAVRYRRVAHVRKGDVRSFKNFYLYPGEYHKLLPHLQRMAPSQVKLLRNSIPTILTRREGDYRPIIQAFQKIGYAEDLASQN